MQISRRTFTRGLAGAAAAAAGGPLLAPGGWAESAEILEAAAGSAQLAPSSYPETAIWGYEGRTPGPLLRMVQGERVSRRLVNKLPQATTVHWHGLRIENEMDGVPDLTQEAVRPQNDFHYEFTPPDAGTYWYHPHNRTFEQMARGLYGGIIVSEADGAPDVDVDEILLIDDWRLDKDAQIAGGFGNLHDLSHAGRIGNWITVNGDGAFERTAAHNGRYRLRLVNTANARIFSLDAKGFDGWIVALDGMPLDAPRPLERFSLAPAQRADLIVDVTAADGDEAFLISHERDGGYAVATFKIDGVQRPERLPTPAPLPANPVAPLEDPSKARHTELVMEGGAMGRMRGAMMGGQMTGMREMAAAGKAWAFNGMADMPDKPLIEAAKGETVRLTMRNDTSWPHAMHLHGHHFRRIAADGTAGPLRDTLLMNRGDTAEIAFVADNPGDWLLHCHMLEHSAAGMMTWIRVS